MSGPVIVAVYVSGDRTKLRFVLDDEETIVEVDALVDEGTQVEGIDLSEGWVEVASYGDNGNGGESW